MDNILITGVSTGIGFASSKWLCDRGFRVFGSVRNSVDAQRIKAEIGEKFIPLLFDVTDQQAIDQAVLELSDILGDEGLLALVNNAGIVVAGPLQHLDLGELELQLDVNVVGVLRTIQAFLPFLNKNNRPGRIINIGSISGIMTRAFAGPYSASKHALEALTDALRRELRIVSKVSVSIIQAGPIKTPIWQKEKEKKDMYEDTDYKETLKFKGKVIDQAEEMALGVNEISALIHKIIISKNPKTRYLITKQKWIIKLMAHVLPDKWVDALFMNQLKRYRSTK